MKTVIVRRSRWCFLATATALLLLFLAEGFWFISRKSQTVDEAIHVCAGYSYWSTGDFHLNYEHPPLTKLLAALPVYLWYRLPFAFPDRAEVSQRQLAHRFLYERAHTEPTADEILGLARSCNLLLGACLVGLIGVWAYRLWGKTACLLGMGLAALEPNLISNSALATTDLGVTLFIFLVAYLCWEYSNVPSYWALLAAGGATGLALASKFSAVLLVGMLPIIVLGFVAFGGSFSLPATDKGQRGSTLMRILKSLLVVSIVIYLGFLALWPVYFFQDPTQWWDGLIWQFKHGQRGHAAFFIGQYSDQGWALYFLIAVLIKTPIGTLLLVAASLCLYRQGSRLGRSEVFFLLVPIALLFLAMAQVKVNIGLRYILPVYPFLLVIAARAATIRFRQKWIAPVGICCLIILSALSVFRIAPHYLAYFNEAVGGPEQGPRYLSDSNIDWGQDLKELKDFLRREGLSMIYLSYFGGVPPEYYGIRYQYLPGSGRLGEPKTDVLRDRSREIIVISVFNLQGVGFADKKTYDWLQRRPLMARIGYSIYAYDITNDAVAHLELAKIYLRHGPRQLAIAEFRRALELKPECQEAIESLQSGACQEN